ncbi:MAG: hypothetical protein K2Q18_07175 [Bdellovibrionales bacterium]|nr:hypothetical protein [Bdellovibrionales bacterium]
MKKISGVFLLSIMVATQVRAADFNCFGEEDSSHKLTIEHSEVDILNVVDVIVTQSVPGVTSVVMTGTFNSSQNKYTLKDQNEKTVQLNFATVTDFGGRCGRCTPFPKFEYFAKLTTEQGQMDFQCFPKK